MISKSVELSINTGASLSSIVSKYMITNDNLIELATFIKNDKDRVNEFIKTFIASKKKISPSLKWNMLIALNQTNYIFKTIHVDNNGKPFYDDESFISYVIQRYVEYVGIGRLHSILVLNINNEVKKYDNEAISLYVIKDFIEEFENFIYSEFSHLYFNPDTLLLAISIIEETDEA